VSFHVSYELVPGRASSGKALNDILTFAREAARDGRIAALSITDNAGGNPALSPKSLGRDIQRMGIQPVIHFSCKDKNRNLIESELFELDRLGMRQLLVVTGDYPRYGFQGNAKPVFDLDSVLALQMVQDMNRGFLLDSRAPGGGVQMPPASFNAGCVVSPFKRLAAELLPQYQKLIKKLASGARFVISQTGYDMRKYHELRLVMNILLGKTHVAGPSPLFATLFHSGPPPLFEEIPLLGTVFIPGVKMARLLHRGVVPGCILPKRLLERMEEEARGPDAGLAARLERAARMIAVLKGMGYDGVHLSGPGLRYEHIVHVLDMAEAWQDRWQAFISEFLFPEEWNAWLFEQDAATGLNSPEFRKGVETATPAIGDRFAMAANMAVHNLFFERNAPFYEAMRAAVLFFERASLGNMLTNFEYCLKGIFYDCQSCGDCTLGEMAFLCPQSQCAKGLLNGPCGGSQNGWCEVWPGRKRCVYVRRYERMQHFHLKGSTNILPPRDWSLYRTSSWLNFFLQKDHTRYETWR
jgi:methylenetetrahydrofolate reductase (NADPH)